jgi:AcrR family transcriptional regulator
VPAGRTRLPTDARREQLLQTGLELFGTRPYGHVATTDLARRAGVSHGLLFHYFGDKRRYYLEVLRWVAERLYSAEEVGGELSAWARLLATLRARVEFAERYTVAFRALVGGGNGADEEVAAMVEEARWRSIRQIAGALGIAEPDARLRIALRGWHGFTEGAIVEWLKARELTAEELVDLLAHELVDTLKRAGVDLSAAKSPR